MHLVSEKSIRIDIDDIIVTRIRKIKKKQIRNTKSHKNIIDIIDLHALTYNPPSTNQNIKTSSTMIYDLIMERRK